MNQQIKIKEKFERNEKALSLKPSIGLGKGISTIRITDGLQCQIKEGNWELKTDMPEQIGGTGNAPSPGILGRAAFGSCLATGYMLWASKLDISINELEIIVEADYDDGALFGTSIKPAGYKEVHYSIKISSPNSHEEIEDFLNIADRHSPYLDVFTREQTCIRKLEITNN
jgi:uncharacterized OsmC-like protein